MCSLANKKDGLLNSNVFVKLHRNIRNEYSRKESKLRLFQANYNSEKFHMLINGVPKWAGAGYYLIKKAWLLRYFWQRVLLKIGWCRDLHGPYAGMIPKSAKCSTFLDIVSAERFWKLKAFSSF